MVALVNLALAFPVGFVICGICSIHPSLPSPVQLLRLLFSFVARFLGHSNKQRVQFSSQSTQDDHK